MTAPSPLKGMVAAIVEKKSPRQEEAANRFLDVRYNHKAFRWEKSSEAGA